MPQRADLHTGGGDGAVVVVVVAGTVLGGACWRVTGGGACSLARQADRRTGTTRLPRARLRRARAMVMTLLDGGGGDGDGDATPSRAVLQRDVAGR
jgi:hypothetical protein